MVKRTSWKHYFYIAFALILLISCWQSNRGYSEALNSTAAATAQSPDAVIPQESIRLRILANSDSPSDQWVKREVRDAIVQEMNKWVKEPQGIEAAREAVRAHLPELNGLVGQTLRQNGFDYSYGVELGIVPFPAKMYGDQIYPAGDYEALRVTIGSAEGQNWWCVLFPPLCFVDSEAVVKKTEVAADTESAGMAEDKAKTGQVQGNHPDKGADTKAVSKSSKANDKKADTEAKAGAGTNGSKQVVSQADREAGIAHAAVTKAGADQPEIRFFLWDLLRKLGSLFA